jgi:hypothetical protein
VLESKDVITKTYLKNKFLTLKMKEGDNMRKHINKSRSFLE